MPTFLDQITYLSRPTHSPERRAKDFNDLISISGLLAIWIVMLIIVAPMGNFPLNDDWVYARSAFLLADTGHLHLSSWSSVTQVVQTFWGAIFCILFGKTFVALRTSTAIIGFVGVMATYFAAREFKASRFFAFIAAATLAVNPIYFGLSCTFMTDVPFFATQALALLYFTRFLARNSRSSYLVGFAFSIASIFVRQIGLVIPLAFAAAYFAKERFKSWKSVAVAMAPFLTGLMLLHFYEIWRASSEIMPSIYCSADSALYRYFAQQKYFSTPIDLRYMLLYCGIFLLPCLLARTGAFMKDRGLMICSAFLSLSIVLNRAPALFINKGNILNAYGFGPILLKDVAIPNSSGIVPIPLQYQAEMISSHFVCLDYSFWLLLTGIATIAAVFLCWAVGTRLEKITIKTASQNWPSILLISIIALYAGLICISFPSFDRYYLPLLLPLSLMLIPVAVQPISLARQLISSVSLVMFAVFSVMTVHDYFAFQTARFYLLDELTNQQKIDPKNIDGGFEFNGYHLYKDTYKPTKEKSSWWVDDDKYAVTLGPVEGYSAMKQITYSRWLPMQSAQIYLMKRDFER